MKKESKQIESEDNRMYRERWAGIVYAVISSITFGLIPLFSIPLMKEGFTVASILLYRFLFASVMMGIWFLIKKQSIRMPGKHWGLVIILAILYTATALLLTHSYYYIPSGVAITIHFLYPVVVSILMVTFFKEKKSLALFLSALLSLAGVFLLSWGGNEEIAFMGILIVLGAVLAYAFYFVMLNQSAANKIKGDVLTFYILSFSTVILFIYTLLITGINMIETGVQLLHLSSLAFLATVISNLTIILAIQKIGSTKAAILGSFEPLVAMVIGVFCFSEPFGFNTLTGTVLILLSVTLVILSKNK